MSLPLPKIACGVSNDSYFYEFYENAIVLNFRADVEEFRARVDGMESEYRSFVAKLEDGFSKGAEDNNLKMEFDGFKDESRSR